MQLHFGRTTMAAPPSFGDGVDIGDGNDMKASLWGELQSFIDLSLIYAKLPLAPFFRLRQVCKEWNRLASDRQFLVQNFKPPFSNLYFVVAQRTGHRLWTARDSSWTSSPLPRRRCEVSGLLYEDSDRYRVFDLHTRVFYSLLPLPPGMKKDDGRGSFAVAMTVDTTKSPYGFRVVIVEDCTSETRIYDSNSGAWTSRLSILQSISSLSTPTCIHYDKCLYMLFEHLDEISAVLYSYDLEKNMWDLKGVSPPISISWRFGGIGLWRDRFFAFGIRQLRLELTAWQMELKAWEMNKHVARGEREYWTRFDCMPKDLCKWITRVVGYNNIRNTFCGEHVLVYNCLEDEERAVLYNLDRKTWDKIELVGNTTVSN